MCFYYVISFTIKPVFLSNLYNFLILSYKEIIKMIVFLYFEKIVLKYRLTECSLKTGSEHL